MSFDALSTPSPLQSLLDRPIAFHRCFVRLGIGITGAVMLSQAVYWSKRTENPEGWFHKSIEEWEEETGLTRFEQETAKRNLKGILEVERRGIPARLYFRINWENLEKSFNIHSLRKSSNQDCGNTANKNDEIPQTRLRKSSKPDCGNPSNRSAEIPQTGLRKSSNHYKEHRLLTEITSETTAEITTPPIPPPPRQTETSTEIPSEGAESTPPSPPQNRATETHTSSQGDGSPSPQREARPGRAKNSGKSSFTVDIPSWLNPKDWNDFLSFRESIRAPMNDIAQIRAIEELERLRTEGHDPSLVITQSILNSWKGLFPVRRDKSVQSGSPGSQKNRPKTFAEIRDENNRKAVNSFLKKMGEQPVFEEGEQKNVVDAQ